MGKQTEREDVGRGLTNESRQVTFADVKRRNGKREKMGRVSVNSYWFTSEKPPALMQSGDRRKEAL